MDIACELYLRSIGFEDFIPVFKENGITKNDIPQLLENDGKYLKELIPKAVDRMNFEKKFYASYEQNESLTSSSFELDLKKRRLDFTPSHSGGESSVILDCSDISTEQSYQILNEDIDVGTVISLDEELACVIEKEDTTSPAVPDSLSEKSDIKDNVRLKLHNFQLAYKDFLSLEMRTC
ncbi:PREDICTED: uncharacterized protein LOC105456903 [Wasmannia auropunctata]|uniref:uncharacterized protein LOC105456903 n=1 Tax=Wasmannia auropunctata TaxID=64793 RepID=UPI0005EFE724|nr:PREDICTED: uncharacterized protein LOC105456903 [Wasmannia auropunctata]